MNLTARTSSVIAGTAIALMLLTGCAGGQSKLEACTILKDGLLEVNTALSDSVGDLQADPEAAAAGMKSAADDFETAVAKITNADVKGPATAAAGSITDFSDAIGDYAADPENADINAVSDSASAVADAVTPLQKTCSA